MRRRKKESTNKIHREFKIAETSAFFEGEVVPEAVCDRMPTRTSQKCTGHTCGHFMSREGRRKRKKWRENFPICFSTNQDKDTVLLREGEGILLLWGGFKKLLLIFPPSFFFSSTSSQSLLHQFLFQFVLLKVLHCLRPFSHFCFVFVILIIFFLNFVIFFLVSFVLSFSFFADLPAKGRTPPSSSSSSPSQPVTQSPTVPAME